MLTTYVQLTGKDFLPLHLTGIRQALDCLITQSLIATGEGRLQSRGTSANISNSHHTDLETAIIVIITITA